MIIKLNSPVKWGSKDVHEITLREPTIGDVIFAAKHIKVGSIASQDDFYTCLANLVSGIPEIVIDAIPFKKKRKIIEYLDEFPLFSLERDTVNDAGVTVSEIPEKWQVAKIDEDDTEAELPVNHPEFSELNFSEDKITGDIVRKANKKLAENVTIDAFEKRNLEMLAEATGIKPDQAKKLLITDYRKAMRVLGFFM